MDIKVGNTHYKNYPERFANNQNKRPIPIIEMWFDDKEKMRIMRDGFFMPKVREIREFKQRLDEGIALLDKENALRK